MSELTEDIENMHKMRDEELIRFYSEISVMLFNANLNANFEKYQDNKPLVQATEYEILQRMKRRNQYRGLL